MSRFILVQQEKGGVGKTFLAIHLTTYLRALGHHYRPVDFDNDPGLTSEVFPPPDSASITPRESLIASGQSMLPSLMERVAQGELFLVDAGANTGQSWETLFTVLPHLREDLKAAGIKWTLIVPVASDQRTHQKFESYANEFPEATRIMVVVREFKEEVMNLPTHPPELTIDLPIAFPNLFSMYRSTKTPIDVIARSNDPRFGVTRAFAKGYIKSLHAEFDKVRKHLVP